MTTPHKALLRQACDALDNLLACEDKCRCSGRLTIAALQAAIDSPEPKGLFIDLIAQHEGLAEELRDLPEPYDQQALEPCPVCGWKAIVPGEPCLMCERNAWMLAPEPEPFAWAAWNDAYGNTLWHDRGEADLYCADDTEPEPLYKRLLAPREPLTNSAASLGLQAGVKSA